LKPEEVCVASSADKYSAYDPQAPLDEGPGPVGYVALVLAWLVPGLGHMLIGQKGRGLLFMLGIHALFAAGLLMGGIRVINPPDQPIWTYTELLTGWPMLVARSVEKASRVELGDHSPQYPTGSNEYRGLLQIKFNQEAPPRETLAQKQARAIEYTKEHPNFAYDPRIQDIGSVYCGIAGMLNLLVMADVFLRIIGAKRPQSETKTPAAPAPSSSIPSAPPSPPAANPVAPPPPSVAPSELPKSEGTP
jgi:hypothetical protein